MHKSLSIAALFALLVAVPLASLADAKADLAAFKAAIKSKYDLKEAAFKNKDPDTIVNKFYSADVVSTGPGDGYTRGSAKLLEQYKQHMDSTVRIESIHTHLNGNNGLDWANFYITPNDPKVQPFSFKILFLWEKRNGEWICIGDMFSRGKFSAADKP